jgi:rSAM/selenodomain-associated transferase 1
VARPAEPPQSPLVAWRVRIAVVIPTWNEARSIGHVLADIPRPPVTEIIVIDRDSRDGTQDIAAAAGARVIIEPRRGYGRACRTGLEQATGADVVVFLDGDYSDRPAELPALVEPILSGRADIVIGSRLAGVRARGALPVHSLFGNWLAARLIRLLYGVPLTDLGPFRAGRADVLRVLDLREDSYGWAVEMILRGALRRARIVEVPVSYHPRIGTSKITGTVRGSLGAAWHILGRIVTYRVFQGQGQVSSTATAHAESPADPDRVLAIMAKAPRPGQVKTRLAAVYPPEAVLDLYRALVEDSIALARQVGAGIAAVCPAGEAEEVARWLPSDVRVVPQRGLGLADGLTSCFDLLCDGSAGRTRRVIAFNSDSPHVAPAVIRSAFQALLDHDVVIGPCDDGGYYLVGAAGSHPGLFDPRTMGTGSACEILLARARQLDLSAAVLAEHYDVDLPEDLERLARDLAQRPERAPRTAAVLARWPGPVT